MLHGVLCDESKFFTVSLRVGYNYCPHFTYEITEVQRAGGTIFLKDSQKEYCDPSQRAFLRFHYFDSVLLSSVPN